MSVLQETNKTGLSKILVGNSLLGTLAKTASSFKPDKELKEVIEKEKQKPGYTKTTTIEFGGIKLPDNEQNQKVIAALQASQQQEIFPGADQVG